MTVATVVIPVSPKHKQTGIYQDAVQSVRTQTVPADHILVFDDNANGAAFSRNKGTSQVITPFVIWLDADDRLRPTFLESCLKEYRRGQFVYTDWVVNGLVINTPDTLNPWDNGQEHVITTLMPITAWQAVGGFDDSLDTLEDEDYYRKLASFGWCGQRVAEPLVEYRRHLGESLVNMDAVSKDIQKQRVAEKVALFNARYGKHRHMANNCGCGTSKNMTPAPEAVGTKQPNDVLVETLYDPQRVEGSFTRRLYPRAGLGKRMWVHEDDARSRPDMFRIVGADPVKVAPDVATVQRLAEEAIAQEQSAVQEVPAEEKPDFQNMLKPELEAYAEEHGIEVFGTGARGRITKDDLLNALKQPI